MGSSPWYQESGADGAPLVEKAKQQTGQMVQQTKEAASRVADQAVDQVKSQLATQKERATDGLASVAEALHETSESLRGRNQDAIGRYAETGAEMMDQLSGYFRNRQIDEIIDDAENFARRQAGLFLGGAFAVGFILSRFFKSSSPNGHARGAYGETNGMGYARASGAMTPAGTGYAAGTAMPPSSGPATVAGEMPASPTTMTDRSVDETDLTAPSPSDRGTQ
jgi:hypothetical protein